jgi:nitric oxide reductase NorD protein
LNDATHIDGVARLGLLASAIARRPLQVAPAEPGETAWTDGRVVFVDAQTSAHTQLEALVVQASLLSAGSLGYGIVHGLTRRPKLARRYLAVEGHRALSTVESLLPPSVRPLIRSDVAALASSPEASLTVARGNRASVELPASFGTIWPKRLLESLRRVEAAHSQPAREAQHMTELADDATTEELGEDNFASQVGGGGPIGKLMAKMLSAVRQIRGGGSPGADSPTHWSRSGLRGKRAVLSNTSTTAFGEDVTEQDREPGVRYPEWDVHSRQYRKDWCTVLEAAPQPKQDTTPIPAVDRTSLRRSLARLGTGPDRRHRQAQGDDLDIDAVVDARVAMMAGSTPSDALFIESVRRRRNLSVLVLLDVSGSAAEPAANGETVHNQQRAAAAALTLALHELGDRVALYAYCSQGRNAVNVSPIKRFAEEPGALVMQRLHGLEPGAYSRLGAAIRHGTTVLRRDGGTPRQLLVVLSDGLAYDHGYEPAYGAADARRALGEARREGIGCLCLSVGASTDTEALRRVFGTFAHAALPGPEHLKHVIAPLFRSAIRSADVRRRLS